jgi:hypothetical protein
LLEQRCPYGQTGGLALTFVAGYKKTFPDPGQGKAVSTAPLILVCGPFGFRRKFSLVFPFRAASCKVQFFVCGLLSCYGLFLQAAAASLFGKPWSLREPWLFSEAQWGRWGEQTLHQGSAVERFPCFAFPHGQVAAVVERSLGGTVALLPLVSLCVNLRTDTGCCVLSVRSFAALCTLHLGIADCCIPQIAGVCVLPEQVAAGLRTWFLLVFRSFAHSLSCCALRASLFDFVSQASLPGSLKLARVIASTFSGAVWCSRQR